MNPKAIGFLGFEGVAASELTSAADVFGAAILDGGYGNRISCYQISTIGFAAECFRAESGIAFWPGIAGEFLPTSFTLTSSLPRNRANFSVFYDGPADTWLGGLDVGAVVHWIAQYEDDNLSIVGGAPSTPRTIPPGTTVTVGRTGQTFTRGDESPFARKVAAWTTLDLILNYTFNLPPPTPAEVPGYAKDGGKNVKMKDGKEKNVVPVSTAEYGCSNWQWWLNNATITRGMQNVLDADPPFVAGNFENGYDESLTTIKGRFWYVGLKKRF